MARSAPATTERLNGTATCAPSPVTRTPEASATSAAASATGTSGWAIGTSGWAIGTSGWATDTIVSGRSMATNRDHAAYQPSTVSGHHSSG